MISLLDPSAAFRRLLIDHKALRISSRSILGKSSILGESLREARRGYGANTRDVAQGQAPGLTVST
jgi:hypothetical protein